MIKYKMKLFPALGTLNSITIYQDGCDMLLNAAKSTVLDLHNRWSLFHPDSEVSKINQSAGKNPVNVMPDTYAVIQQGYTYHQLTDGAYDMTAGKLYLLWKQALKRKKIPAQKEIAATVHHRHMQALQKFASLKNIHFYDKQSAIYLTDKKIALDFGGIAKGYISGLLKQKLEHAGVTNALINLGGTVAVIGDTRQIGIKNPFTTDNIPIGYFPLSNQYMVTSGSYEQCMIDNGSMYHHIIDPRTGYPANTNLVSVTLIGDEPAMLDAFATAILVMGIEKGFLLLSKNRLEAVLITTDGTILTTPGLKDSFVLHPSHNVS